jgi:hypothetical protein
MRLISCFFAALAFAPVLTMPAAADTPAPPRTFLLDAKYLAATRQRINEGDTNVAPALDQLKRDADEALHAGPYSIVNKGITPPSGDKHDYMSMAPYYWPDPSKPAGAPYIRRDGERNPEIRKVPDHRVMDEMAGTVETLALAYYFTGNEAYADKAAIVLRAWFIDPPTRMNPNLQFAQAVSGVNTGRGTGLIESRSLARVVDAIGLLAGSKAWTAEDQHGLEDWYSSFLKWMLESKNGQAESAAKNNHGSHYDVQITSFMLFLGKRDEAKKVIETARTKRIDRQIEADGTQPLELVRTRSWGYSIFNLGALMDLGTLGDELGVDLWHYKNPNGAGIRTALDYLIPFDLDGKKWPHQQIGGWPPQQLNPLILRAALKYSDKAMQDAAARVPAISPSSRLNLTSPKHGTFEAQDE